MKKGIFRAVLFICFITAVILLPVLGAYAQAADGIDGSTAATAEGGRFLRSGSSYTVSYRVRNISCCGFQGNLYIENPGISTVGISSDLRGWSAEISQNGDFLVYSNSPDDDLYDYTGDSELFKVTFDIGEDVVSGTEIAFIFRNVIASDAKKDINIPDISFTKSVDAPESSESSLKNLMVQGVNTGITPAFSPDIFDYNILYPVDYETESLDIIASVSDDMAKCEISGNELQIGKNTVVVKVTAENGDISEYRINVVRNHGDDWAYSGNSKLSSITLSAGTLSPAFSPDIKEYIVYLPYECESLEISAEPENVFAREVTAESGALKKGFNELSIRCEAEDTTSSIYTVTAYVMPEYSGFVPDIINALPLKGKLEVEGEYKTGNKLSAYIAETSDEAYTVAWYRDNIKIAEGRDYTLSREDSGHTVYPIAAGAGNYYGTIAGESFYINGNGEGTASEVEKDHGIGQSVFIIIITAAVSVAFSAGVLINRKKTEK